MPQSPILIIKASILESVPRPLAPRPSFSTVGHMDPYGKSSSFTSSPTDFPGEEAENGRLTALRVLFLGLRFRGSRVFFPKSGPVWGALVGLATWSRGPWSPGPLAPWSPGLLVPWSPGPWSPGPLCLCFASSY